MTAATLVKQLKEADQDFEWYPTTDEIIDAVIADLKHLRNTAYHRYSSILDIGAGNGKVLSALRKKTSDYDGVDGLYDLHAIEKSAILCEQMDDNILIVGTDFAEQSLLSKNVDIIFCNPPYSEYEQWTEKIIRQSVSKLIYLVIPERWEKSERIADAMKYRGVSGLVEIEKHELGTKVVGKFDFLNAERQARAKVHLLRITMRNDDAFELFFKEQFGDLCEKFEKDKEDDEPEDDKAQFRQLVVGPNYPEALVNLYDAEMAHIENNYQLVGQLDVGLLKEFEISPETIMKLLKTRLSGLRNKYWKELFSNLDTITNRLTAKSRSNLLDTLNKHVHVDFTVPNIYVIVIWVIKNANRYIDSQLINVYEDMVEKCNVAMYKSNQKTWQQEGWRYCQSRDENSHYKLDYRIVAHHIGGMKRDSWKPGLEDRAADFIHDLQVISKNLGFGARPEVLGWDQREKWQRGETYEFPYYDQGRHTLFDVKAFDNGNLHLRLNQDFILALNVEFGRLKGWLNSGAEAAEELKDKKAAKYFGKNVQLMGSDLAMLPAPVEESTQLEISDELLPLFQLNLE